VTHENIDRHTARILAMQALCQLDAQGDDFRAHLPGFIADANVMGPTSDYAHRLIEAAWSNRKTVAAELAEVTPEWSIDRMTPVDRNTIRVAVAELDLAEAPPKVILNEAVEIGREYGAAESPKFINGVIDAVWKAQTRGGSD
jgi:N utilization substance protein B